MSLTLYFKDSTVDMSGIATGTIDLILTSPPYWNIVDYKHSHQLGKGLTYKHFLHVLKNNLLECMRVLKEDGIAVFVVGDIRKEASYASKVGRPRIYSLHSDIIQFFTEMDFDFFQHHIWQKNGVKKSGKERLIYGNANLKDYAFPPYLYTDLLIEHILVFRKPGTRRVVPSQQELLQKAYTSILKKELQEWLNPVWNISSPIDAEHPATFPTELVRRIIRLYSLEEDIVLDPFVGSGTTFRVAESLHRNVIGFENNENYIKKLVTEFDLKPITDTYYSNRIVTE